MSLFSVQSAPNCFSNIFPQIQIQDLLPKINFQDIISKVQMAGTAVWNFRDHAISELDAWDHRLDQLMPNFPIQTRIDQLLQELEQTFAPLTSFNNWLNSNGHGEWYHQLAESLAKLPFRSARNIIQQLYLLIKGIVYGAVHPLKALNNAAKFLVMLPYEFAKPETWSKMGIGMIGSSLGDAAIMGGFTSLVGVGVGGAMLVGGLSVGTLRRVLEAEEHARWQAASTSLCQQVEQLTETFLTSFFMGLIIAAVRKAIQSQAQKQPHAEKQQPKAEPKTPPTRSADFFDVVEKCRSNPDGYPPVAYAVKLGRHDVVKFLIDNKESVNLATPSFPIWNDTGFDKINWRQVATQPGYTPLEIAIQQGDVEMVKILTSYDPANCADITLNTTRYPYAFPATSIKFPPVNPEYFDMRGKYTFDYNNYITSSVASTPLSQAISLGNKEIIECIIKSYTSPEKLLGVYEQIRALQQESIMRLWIEQHALLWKGTSLPITEETVQLFLLQSPQQAIEAGNISLIKQYIESGWTLSKQAITKIFATKDASLIKLLVQGARLENGVNPMMVATEMGAVDILKSYIQQGMSFEGMLLHAVDQKQLEVVKYLLEFPISQTEISQAYTRAYQNQAHGILAVLDNKRFT